MKKTEPKPKPLDWLEILKTRLAIDVTAISAITAEERGELKIAFPMDGAHKVVELNWSVRDQFPQWVAAAVRVPRKDVKKIVKKLKMPRRQRKE